MGNTIHHMMYRTSIRVYLKVVISEDGRSWVVSVRRSQGLGYVRVSGVRRDVRGGVWRSNCVRGSGVWGGHVRGGGVW